MSPFRIVVVTPAGRERYMRILSQYVLSDDSVCEWVLWDNCRNNHDREYMSSLIDTDPRVRIERRAGADGTYPSVSKFWDFEQRRDTFYVKVDDDIVYCQPGLFSSLLQAAISSSLRDRTLFYSPLVVNNVICTWLLKHHSKVDVPEYVRLSVFDSTALEEVDVAARLHEQLIEELLYEKENSFQVRDFFILLNRFSINCVGWFGDMALNLGANWKVPDGYHDEEWYTGVLSSRFDLGTQVFGSLLSSHFAYKNQESRLLLGPWLDKYRDISVRSGIRPG